MRDTVINLSSDKEIASARQALKLKAQIANGGGVGATRMDDKVGSVDVEVISLAETVVELCPATPTKAIQESTLRPRVSPSQRSSSAKVVWRGTSKAPLVRPVRPVKITRTALERPRVTLSQPLPSAEVVCRTNIVPVPRAATQATTQPPLQRPPRLPPPSQHPPARLIPSDTKPHRRDAEEIGKCLAAIRTSFDKIGDEQSFNEAINNYYLLLSLLSYEIPDVGRHEFAVSENVPPAADDDVPAARGATQAIASSLHTTPPPALQRPPRLPPSQRSPAARVVWKGPIAPAPDSSADCITPASHRSPRLPPPSQHSPRARVVYKGQATTPSTLLDLNIGPATRPKKKKKKCFKLKHLLHSDRSREDEVREYFATLELWRRQIGLENVVEENMTEDGEIWSELERCKKERVQETLAVCRRLAGMFTEDDEASGGERVRKACTQDHLTTAGRRDQTQAMRQDVSQGSFFSSSAASCLDPNPRKRKRTLFSCPPTLPARTLPPSTMPAPTLAPLNKDTACDLDVHHPVRFGGGKSAKRKFRIPPDARNDRSKRTDYPRKGEPLERGFVKGTLSCNRCSRMGIWCTYGDGKDRWGKPRGEGEGRCDRCVHLDSSCSLFSRKRSKKNRP